MDRIEELLERLLDTQACATFYREVQGSFDDTRSTEARVEAIVGIIAADWRAMVEALEGGLDLLYGLTQWIPNDEQEILERMHTTLARVKENDA